MNITDDGVNHTEESIMLALSPKPDVAAHTWLWCSSAYHLLLATTAGSPPSGRQRIAGMSRLVAAAAFAGCRHASALT